MSDLSMAVAKAQNGKAVSYQGLEEECATPGPEPGLLGAQKKTLLVSCDYVTVTEELGRDCRHTKGLGCPIPQPSVDKAMSQTFCYRIQQAEVHTPARITGGCVSGHNFLTAVSQLCSKTDSRKKAGCRGNV